MKSFLKILLFLSFITFVSCKNELNFKATLEVVKPMAFSYKQISNNYSTNIGSTNKFIQKRIILESGRYDTQAIAFLKNKDYYLQLTLSDPISKRKNLILTPFNIGPFIEQRQESNLQKQYRSNTSINEKDYIADVTINSKALGVFDEIREEVCSKTVHSPSRSSYCSIVDDITCDRNPDEETIYGTRTLQIKSTKTQYDIKINLISYDNTDAKISAIYIYSKDLVVGVGNCRF